MKNRKIVLKPLPIPVVGERYLYEGQEVKVIEIVKREDLRYPIVEVALVKIGG